ncbi:MAG: M15 family metallopeptidase [Chitinispirillaceae bacterium]
MILQCQNPEKKQISFVLPALLFIGAAFLFPLGSQPVQSIEHYRARLEALGMVDVRSVDSTLRVELKYADPGNFTGINLYGELKECYLQADAARKLAEANSLLKKMRPDLTILVADGLRPRHVQQKMWDVVKGTPQQRYVANPHTGSMHNYGCAVDVTICDSNGRRLDMGTPIDHFGPLSQPRLEKKYLREGKLTREHVENRKLLRKVMVQAGFHPLAIEWWHFEAFEKGEIRRKFTIVE